MSIVPDGEIGEEVHVFVTGEGTAILDGRRNGVRPGRLVRVPAGIRHIFINTGKTDLRLFTTYAPPEHAPDTIQRTGAEADAAEAEHAR